MTDWLDKYFERIKDTPKKKELIRCAVKWGRTPVYNKTIILDGNPVECAASLIYPIEYKEIECNVEE